MAETGVLAVGTGSKSAARLEAARREAVLQLVTLGRDRAATLERLAELGELRRREERLRPNESPPKHAARYREEWDATRPERDELHAAVRSALAPWLDALAQDSSADTLASPSLAAHAVDLLERALALTAPDRLLAEVEHEALGNLLGGLRSSARRRAFLSGAAARVVALPGRSDVDALLHVLRWEALFLTPVPPGREQLDVLTRDLMAIFTERGPDGFSASGSTLYAPSRYRDFGFASTLRDDSDQVRHFAWALRLFSLSSELGGEEAVEELLRLKERLDAERRGSAMNAADLELNERARRLVQRLLGTSPGPVPPTLRATLPHVRAALTGEATERRSAG